MYTITTAEDKVEAAKHEGAITGAGIAGGAAGGALAGLMCGPGAPVCVTIEHASTRAGAPEVSYERVPA